MKGHQSDKQWSTAGQTAEYLALTRSITLNDSIARTIVDALELYKHEAILDVGCGSGEYCFRLGAQVANVGFTGIDSDSDFIELANKRSSGEAQYPFEKANESNSYNFICADGLCLPFDDATFDAVISHTYLTAVKDWKDALDEMIRVCKQGGIVSSVNSLTDDFYGTGIIDLFAGVTERIEYDALGSIRKAKDALFDYMEITSGIAPRDVPIAFKEAGLKHIRCKPLGQYFCLSDDSIAAEEYQRHVDLLLENEREQYRRLKTLNRFTPILSEDDFERYHCLIEKRGNELMSMIGKNPEWNWFGNASLLVIGEV